MGTAAYRAMQSIRLAVANPGNKKTIFQFTENRFFAVLGSDS